MKKTLFLCLLLFGLIGWAQQNKAVVNTVLELKNQNTSFKKFQVLTPISQTNSLSETVVQNATYAKVDFNSLGKIQQEKPKYIEISIPYDGQMIDVLLYRVNIFTHNFRINTNLQQDVPYLPGIFYRGIIKNNPESLASFTFFDDKFSGIVSAQEFQNLNIGKLEMDHNKSDYIVYSDARMNVAHEFECGTEDFNPDHNDMAPTTYYTDGTRTNRCVTMYYELDYDLYLANNSNIDDTMDWLTSAYNNMQTLYDNDNITIALNEVFIWETQDPYQGAGGSGSYLARFNQERPVFPGDVAQLIGANDNSGGGVAASIAGLCTSDNYSYAGVNVAFANVPTYSWTIMVMTHEHGHVIGSRHTHACVWNGNNTAIDGCAGFVEGNCTLPPNPPEGGTIMSYCHLANGINFTLGFGPQPGTAIVNHINGSECLSVDCISTCFNTINSVTITEINQTSIVATWTDSDSENNQWQYATRIYGSNAPLTWVDTTTNTVTIQPLQPNSYYYLFVRKRCGDNFTPAYPMIFATDGDFCNGDVFTDTGGASGQYSDDENIVRTIVPVDGFDKINVRFTQFNLENNWDFMYIYNGLDTSNLLATLTGNQGLGNTYESTDVSGALTFRFVSDEMITAAGWVGEIECLTLGLNDVSGYLDFSYYPNPVQDILHIQAKSQILEYSLYNLEGKRLNSAKVNSLKSNIQLNHLPAGTYVVELKFKEKPVQFKIIKK
jgi:hypothetical protein